jgi:chemotaxis protein methyltransferase CheR
VSILATDINTSVIEQAERGVYSGRTLQFMPEVLLKRYFRKAGNEEYQICEEIKKRIQFREHNLLKEEPPARDFDLIFCRNVMIYFDKQTQRRLVDESFARALLPDGFLFIGHSESLIGASEVFKYARLKSPIYVFKKSEECG